MKGLKPCPFCGGKDIRANIQSATSERDRKAHIYCYGCFIKTKAFHEDDDIVGGPDFKEAARKFWNKRYEDPTDHEAEIWALEVENSELLEQVPKTDTSSHCSLKESKNEEATD